MVYWEKRKTRGPNLQMEKGETSNKGKEAKEAK